MAFSQSHTTTFSLQRERGRGHSPLPNVHIFNTATQDRLTYSAEGASGADALRDAETAYETELLRVIASQDGGYWFSDERRWSSNTDWAPIRSIFMALYRVTANLRIWIKLYGLTGGLAVAFFGKSDVWKKQVQVLGSFRPPPALEFKKIIEKESSTVGISGAIITQAAFTALSLPSLTQTHWASRASCIFSLLSALLAVYYAGSQVWTMSYLSDVDEIKCWLRAGRNGIENVLEEWKTQDDRARFESIVRSLVPAPSSVLIVSAPRLLLSAALKFLLIGLGIYLGFLWTKKLDISAAVFDNRNVFIVYLASLILCYGVYTLSGLDHDSKTSATVRQTIRRTLAGYLEEIERSKERDRELRREGKEKVEWEREQLEEPYEQKRLLLELERKRVMLEQAERLERENLERKRVMLEQAERLEREHLEEKHMREREQEQVRWEWEQRRKREREDRENRKKQKETHRAEWEQRRAAEIKQRMDERRERRERQQLEQQVRELERQLLEIRSPQEKREWALVKWGSGRDDSGSGAS